MPFKSLIQFEDVEIDRAAYELRRGGIPCPVEPQVFELLAYLAANPGRLVTKDELIEKVWAGRIVSDAALASRIKSARRAIGDDGEQQRFIRTVHGRGVKFVAAIAAERAAGLEPQPVGHRVPNHSSIGVVPLRAIGAEDIESTLAAGLTEDLIVSLTRDRTFPVISHEALRPIGAAAGDGRSAGVRYLLEGSVRRRGERLVVTIRLTDAADGQHIWAERFEHGLDAMLAFDDRIARLIAAAARSEVQSAEAARAARLPEEECGAWGHYHLGLREMYRFTRSGIAAARAHFRRAVALDPEFAPAHARLAYAEIQDYWYGTRGGREQALMHAQEDAARAIALDPKNALGHFALGRVHALHHDFDAAMPAFETAIRLNPSLAQARFALGQAHLYAGRAREAVRLLDTAIELDPHDPHRWAFLHDQSDGYYALGDLNEAAQRARAASRFPNATHWPLATLASVLGSAGKLEEAREALFELRAKLPDYTFSFAETEFEHVMDKSFVQRFLQGLQAAGL